MSTCPRCGGAETLEISPGYFECQSTEFYGVVPPELSGLPGPIPHHGVCGHRYQVATATDRTPCEVPGCGRDSVGTCQGGCERRLCGLCGSSRGSFVCADCIAEHKLRVDERERARRDAESREAAEHARSLVELSRAIASEPDPENLVELLSKGSPGLDFDACWTAWSKIANATLLPPTNELVTMQFRELFTGPKVREVHRSPVWDAGPGGGWLDSRGRMWKACGFKERPDGFLARAGIAPIAPSTQIFAIPFGASSEMKSTVRKFEGRSGLNASPDVFMTRVRKWTLEGGVPVESRTIERQFASDRDTFVSAVLHAVSG